MGANGGLDYGAIIDLHEVGVGMKVGAINVGLHVGAIDSALNRCRCNQCRARHAHKWLGCWHTQFASSHWEVGVKVGAIGAELDVGGVQISRQALETSFCTIMVISTLHNKTMY